MGVLVLFSNCILCYIESGGASMNITSDIKPVTWLMANAAALLDQINEIRRAGDHHAKR